MAFPDPISLTSLRMRMEDCGLRPGHNGGGPRWCPPRTYHLPGCEAFTPASRPGQADGPGLPGHDKRTLMPSMCPCMSGRVTGQPCTSVLTPSTFRLVRWNPNTLQMEKMLMLWSRVCRRWQMSWGGSWSWRRRAGMLCWAPGRTRRSRAAHFLVPKRPVNRRTQPLMIVAVTARNPASPWKAPVPRTAQKTHTPPPRACLRYVFSLPWLSPYFP